jgi:hypothetical protein
MWMMLAAQRPENRHFLLKFFLLGGEQLFDGDKWFFILKIVNDLNVTSGIDKDL